ncbi:MAG: hypothetical protein E7348_00055 [Clostridiales bacterium]|nr:hypothetical protein [Clostridiales bacterium]
MKTIKQKITIILFSLCLIFFHLALICLPNTTLATSSEYLFTMEKGAQLALHKDGMRFVTKMSQSVYDTIVTMDTENQVSLSVLLSTRSRFDRITDGKYINLDRKIVFNIPDNKIYKVGDYYYANALLTNLNAQNNSALNGVSQFDYQFVALATIVDTSSGQAVYTYADFADGNIDNNTRSQYGMLQSIVLNNQNLEFAQDIISNDTPYSSWFGKGDYPIVIDTQEKYNSLVAQINDGLQLDLDILIYADVDKSGATLEQGKELPQSVTNVYTVNFYNGDKIINTVYVKEGQEVVHDGETPTNDSDIAYVFIGWSATADGQDIIDLSNINSNLNVYAVYEKEGGNSSVEQARTGDDTNTVFFFDRSLGKEQLGEVVNGNLTDITYDTGVKIQGEQGSTKISFDTTSTSKVNITFSHDICGYKFNEGDYVVFYVYSDFDNEGATFKTTVSSPSYATRLINNTWSMVLVPASVVQNDNEWIITSDSSKGIKGSIYLTKAKAIANSEVINCAKEGTSFNFAGIEYVGVAENQTGSDCGGNTNLYNQPSDLSLHYINGRLRYYMGPNADQPYVTLKMKNAFTVVGGSTTVSITLRGGLYETLYLKFSGVNSTSQTTTVSEQLQDGFVKYSFTFINRRDGHIYDTIKIYAAYLSSSQYYTGGYRQVEISNIEIKN